MNLRDAQAFVIETHGPGADVRVLEALPEEARRVMGRPIRELDWYPLEALERYLVVARRLLEPDSPDFFRRQGRFAASRRKGGPLIEMVATPVLRMKLAPTVFRIFYDTGRLEVVGLTPETAAGHLYDFPASEALCERFCGIWEGMGDGQEAVEAMCVRRGDPYCEFRLVARI
jgi:hypothetical protein